MIDSWGSALIAHILTAGGTIVGVLLVYLQVQKQHQSSLVLQEEHLKNEIRLRVYERIADAVENASNLIGDAISEARRAMMTLGQPDDRLINTSTSRGSEISNAHSRAIGAVATLMTIIERYDIAVPGFVAIRKGLGEGASERQLVRFQFINRLSEYLPMDPLGDSGSGTPIGPLRSRTAEGMSELEALYDQYQEDLYTLEAYTADVRIEAQTVLLGQLFGRRVPVRQPGDPKYRVLKAESEPS